MNVAHVKNHFRCVILSVIRGHLQRYFTAIYKMEDILPCVLETIAVSWQLLTAHVNSALTIFALTLSLKCSLTALSHR